MPRNRPIYLAREPSKLRFWSETRLDLAPLPPVWGQGAGGWGVFGRATKTVGRQIVMGGRFRRARPLDKESRIVIPTALQFAPLSVDAGRGRGRGRRSKHQVAPTDAQFGDFAQMRRAFSETPLQPSL